MHLLHLHSGHFLYLTFEIQNVADVYEECCLQKQNKYGDCSLQGNAF